MRSSLERNPDGTCTLRVDFDRAMLLRRWALYGRQGDDWEHVVSGGQDTAVLPEDRSRPIASFTAANMVREYPDYSFVVSNGDAAESCILSINREDGPISVATWAAAPG